MKSKLLCLLLVTMVMSLSAVCVYGQQTSPKSWRSSINEKLPVRPDLTEVSVRNSLMSSSKQQSSISTASTSLLESVIFQNRSGEEWVDGYGLVFTYENSKLIESVYEVWHEDQWLPVYITLNTFEGNDLISTTFKYSQGPESEPEFAYRFLLEYEEIGGRNMLKTMIFQDWDGDEWVNEERNIIIYENGLLTEVYFTEWDGEDWGDVSERLLFTEDGNDLIEIAQYLDGDEWVNDYRVINYSLSAAEFYELVIDELQWDYHVIDEHIESDYTEQYWYEDDWVNSYRKITEYVYEERADGRLLHRIVTWENYFEDDWQGSHREKLDYNDDGLLERITDSYGGDGDWYDYSYNEMVYNDDNVLVMVIQYIDEFESFELSERILLNWGDMTTSVEPAERALTYRLDPAYPNPFNPVTNLNYSLAAAGPVKIQVHDVLGRHVATLVDRHLSAGEYTTTFRAGNLPGGVYLIRFEAPGYSQTRMVTLLK